MHTRLFVGLAAAVSAAAIAIPSTAPSSAVAVNSALVSVSLEFFAFPGYTQITSTIHCLANLASLRGAQPAVRIGGTTQDRATYDATLSTAVNYTVVSAGDAPTTLTFGPSFFTLAAALKGDVTIGLNRQLNDQSNTLAAAVQAKNSMPNLLSIELGNEPEYYAAGSPIITANGGTWNPTVDGQSQKTWFTDLAPSVGNIFQGGVHLEYPTWSTAQDISILGSSVSLTKTFSGHSYPQSASTANLPNLMSHSAIVSYTSQYKSEASAAHNGGKQYFLGETNSATGGGGGISPTYGAALWIVDYVLQGALNGIDRLYFHQGTIGNCQYCWWGRYTVGAPYYGAAFVTEFLGTNGAKLSMLDDGTGAVGSYVVYTSSNTPARLLVYNSAYYDGTGTRSSTTVSFSGGGVPTSGTITAKRLTAPASTSRVDEGAAVTIGGGSVFDSTCQRTGTQTLENVTVSGGAFSVTLMASEALIVYL